ncbi:LPS translocon maturation chaperone LptM [Aestuariirhabdus litorea]
MRTFVPLLLAIGLLTGCGQKGPLYLPEAPAAYTPAPSVQQ